MSNLTARKLVIRLFISSIVMGLVFFLPAGSFRYWQAWIYLASLLVCMLLIMGYLLKHDKGLLERRLKMREKVTEQKKIINWGKIVFLLLFMIPGLDYRFGWSHVSNAVIIVSYLFFFFGYIIFYLTLKSNSYASRIIEVGEGQKVITTGPYAIVRHPMYSSILLIMGVTPLCLGSWWGMLCSTLPLFLILIFRIGNEEKILLRDLPGYEEYTNTTKYRLIPKIW